MKPVINLDELEFKMREKGPFQSKMAEIAPRIGAKKLGYNLTVVPPGKKAFPFHNHHVNEEMFLILEGTGTLRFGDAEYPLRAFDVIAAPPGKRHLAHQIINTGKTELKYFALGTDERYESCEYPDSNKVSITIGDDWENLDVRKYFKADQDVDYWEGEV